jgi:hypothetical protein
VRPIRGHGPTLDDSKIGVAELLDPLGQISGLGGRDGFFDVMKDAVGFRLVISSAKIGSRCSSAAQAWPLS